MLIVSTCTRLTCGADKVLFLHHLVGTEQQSLALPQLMPVINNKKSLSTVLSVDLFRHTVTVTNRKRVRENAFNSCSIPICVAILILGLQMCAVFNYVYM